MAAVARRSLLCLNLGSRYFELRRLNKTESALDASIQDAFRVAMPDQHNPANARRRVEVRVAQLHGSGGDGAMLPALAAVASARSAAPAASSKDSPLPRAHSSCA